VESLRSVFFFKNNNDRIPYFDIRYLLFQSFFFDLTGLSFAGGWAEPCHQAGVDSKPGSMDPDL